MTDKKRRRLSLEILGDLAIALAASVFLYFVLYFISLYIADGYLFAQNIELSQIDYDYMTGWIFSLSLVISAVVFVILFVLLLGQRLAYIPKITRGIEALRSECVYEVEVEGNNELSELAGAINELSITQRRVREEEAMLNTEKEHFVRAVSHDIRTPLTAIMAYTEYMLGTDLGKAETRQYISMINKKSEQIKRLTDIMLDSGMRRRESFDDIRLLFEQLADGFTAALEDKFSVETEISIEQMQGRIDVGEMQRLFDNLISNVQKYAESSAPVKLWIFTKDGQVMIEQKNVIRKAPVPHESHGIGLLSIRQIALLYGGKAEAREKKGKFTVTVTLNDLK